MKVVHATNNRDDLKSAYLHSGVSLPAVPLEFLPVTFVASLWTSGLDVLTSGSFALRRLSLTFRRSSLEMSLPFFRPIGSIMKSDLMLPR